MPITQNPVTTGTVMSRADLDINLQLIESYMRGSVPGADLATLIDKNGRVDEQNFILFNPPPFEIGIPIGKWSRDVERMNHLLPLDSEAVQDWTFYGSPFADAGQFTQTLDFDENRSCGHGWVDAPGNIGYPWQSKYVFERLGNVPEPDGHPDTFRNIIWSWNNWRYNYDPPAWTPGLNDAVYEDYSWTRFPDGELWDSWKTVPYASAKIYVPGPCQLFVQSWARGTWNMVGHNVPLTSTGSQIGPTENEWASREPKDDPPTVFRMFVDKAHDPDSRIFEWDSNGKAYKANWSPIQPEREVGPGARGGNFANVGREWKMSTWPRGVVRCASEVFIPEEGYYTISLRYNSVYWHGFANETNVVPLEHAWHTGCAPQTAPDITTQSLAWGLNLVSRFEASGIQAVAQLKRTGQANAAGDAQFL